MKERAYQQTDRFIAGYRTRRDQRWDCRDFASVGKARAWLQAHIDMADYAFVTWYGGTISWVPGKEA